MEKKLCNKIYQINYLIEDIDSLYHQAALKLGVSDSVMSVLYMLYTSHGERMLNDIYKLSGISKQTINSAIRKLEKDGLIYLEHYNGKSKRICFTEEGKIYADQTVSRIFQAECSVFNEWTDEEVDLYLKFIQRYNASFRNEINKL